MQELLNYEPKPPEKLSGTSFVQNTEEKLKSLVTMRAGTTKPSDVQDCELWQKTTANGKSEFFVWKESDNNGDGTHFQDFFAAKEIKEKEEENTDEFHPTQLAVNKFVVSYIQKNFAGLINLGSRVEEIEGTIGITNYDFRANDARFLHAKLLLPEYQNKTYIQMAQDGAVDVFDKTKIELEPCSIRLNVDGVNRFLINLEKVEIEPAAILDEGSALNAGVDYYLYLVPDGDGVKIVCSLNASFPVGYTEANTRKIGGFHTLCVNAGALTRNIASGYYAGNIIPNSIWCLGFRPFGSTVGAVYIDEIDQWGHIYLQSGTGANTTSVYNATITDTRYPQAHIQDLAEIGYYLPTDNEFTVMAWGTTNQVNIRGSADPVTTGGHFFTNNDRIISTYFLEDMCGVLWQWLNSTSASGGSNWTIINNPAGASFYGSCYVLLAGSSWSGGAACGWGCRAAGDGRGALLASCSARGLSRALRIAGRTL